MWIAGINMAVFSILLFHKMKSLIAIIFLLPLIVCQGQSIKVDSAKSIQENEKILVALADTMFHRGWNTNPNDSFDFEDVFIANLLQVLKSPQSFNYKFPLLNYRISKDYAHRVNVIYSNDGLFRVFNWLSPTSGTFHHFPAIFQARSKSGKIVISYPEATYSEGNQASTAYLTIYLLNKASKQEYLCLGYGQGSGILPFEMIETYEVTNDSIVDSKILQDSSNMVSGILIDREATMSNENPHDIPMVKYDSKNQTLIIPEIKMGDIRWTGKLIQLKFDGVKFIRL